MEIISKAEAIKQGLNYYFTGKPCKRGHIAYRLLSSPHCSQCNIEKRKKRYQNNIEQQRETARNYYHSNKQKAASYSKQWQQQNKDYIYEKNKRWRAQNTQKANELNKIWRINNRAYILHKNAMRKKHIKLATPQWADLIAIRRKYELATWCSQIMGNSYHVDHIIPLKGKLVCGLHVCSNLQIIPAADNLKKNNFFKEQ